MPQHLNKAHCIVGKMVWSKKRILIDQVVISWIDGIRTGGKGTRAPNFTQVGQSLANISFLKLCMLDVDAIGNTNFYGKDL